GVLVNPREREDRLGDAAHEDGGGEVIARVGDVIRPLQQVTSTGDEGEGGGVGRAKATRYDEVLVAASDVEELKAESAGVGAGGRVAERRHAGRVRSSR